MTPLPQNIDAFLRFAFKPQILLYKVRTFGLYLAKSCFQVALSHLMAGSIKILQYFEDWIPCRLIKELVHWDTLDSLSGDLSRLAEALKSGQSVNGWTTWLEWWKAKWSEHINEARTESSRALKWNKFHVSFHLDNVVTVSSMKEYHLKFTRGRTLVQWKHCQDGMYVQRTGAISRAW